MKRYLLSLTIASLSNCLLAPKIDVKDLERQINKGLEVLAETEIEIEINNTKLEALKSEPNTQVTEAIIALEQSKKAYLQALTQGRCCVTVWNLKRKMEEAQAIVKETIETRNNKISALSLEMQTLRNIIKLWHERLAVLKAELDFAKKLEPFPLATQDPPKRTRNAFCHKLSSGQIQARIPETFIETPGSKRVEWLVFLFTPTGFLDQLISSIDPQGLVTCSVCSEPLVTQDLIQELEKDWPTQKISNSQKNILLIKKHFTLPYHCIENHFSSQVLTITQEQALPYLSHIMHRQCSENWAKHSKNCPTCRAY